MIRTLRNLWDFITGIFDRGFRELPEGLTFATKREKPSLKARLISERGWKGFRPPKGYFKRSKLRMKRNSVLLRKPCLLGARCKVGTDMFVARRQFAMFHGACRTEGRRIGLRSA